MYSEKRTGGIMPVLVWTMNTKNKPCPCILFQEQVTGTGQAKAIKAVQEHILDSDEARLPLDKLVMLYPCTFTPEE
jgi:hypothetical protein